MKHQPKLDSLFESVVSNLIGFILTILAQLVIFPDQTWMKNLEFSSILLVLHVIRSYLVRRAFNSHAVKKAKERKAEKKRLKEQRNGLGTANQNGGV